LPSLQFLRPGFLKVANISMILSIHYPSPVNDHEMLILILT
jgi:hypothetical protein